MTGGATMADEILRLYVDGWPARRIADALGVHRGAVDRVLRRVRGSGAGGAVHGADGGAEPSQPPQGGPDEPGDCATLRRLATKEVVR